MSQNLFSNDHNALFKMWKAPESPSGIPIPNIHDAFEVTDLPVLLKSTTGGILKGWTFSELDEVPRFSVRVTPVGSQNIYIDLLLDPTKQKRCDAMIFPSNRKPCIFCGISDIKVPLDQVFLSNSNYGDDQKYEPIFPHREFLRLTDNRQSLGNRFLLNRRPITGPTGHRLSLISEAEHSAHKPIDRINLRLVHHELYCAT